MQWILDSPRDTPPLQRRYHSSTTGHRIHHDGRTWVVELDGAEVGRSPDIAGAQRIGWDHEYRRRDLVANGPTLPWIFD